MYNSHNPTTYQIILYGRGDCMLKKKINGSWQNISMLKKRVNGAWSDCSTVQKKYNGTWSIVWERIFLDWVLSIDNYFSSSSASSNANGNIIIQAARPYSSGANISISTSNNITMQNNETLYLDFYASGSTVYYQISMSLTSGSTTYASSNDVRCSGGQVSMTRGSSTATGQLSIFLKADTDAPLSSSITLNITKIYSDSKVYYWDTKTIK